MSDEIIGGPCKTCGQQGFFNCCGQEEGKAIEHQPTFVSVDKEVLKAALHSVETGLGHLQGALIEHNILYPSPTLKAKVWGNRMERDIATLKRTENELRKCLGWPEK